MAVTSLKKQLKKKSKINYKLKIVLSASMIAAIIFFVVLLFLTFMISKNNLDSNGSVKNPLLGAYVIVSESMIPTIEVNDAIVVQKVDDNNLEVGDIITFNSKDFAYKGLTVTHRIVGIQKTPTGESIYRTKGDNNTFVDTALVDFNNIYGKVILVIPKIGYIKNYLSSPAGFITLIILPIVVVVLYEVFRIKKLLNKQKREMEAI